jgi:hypothetical protein
MPADHDILQQSLGGIFGSILVGQVQNHSKTLLTVTRRTEAGILSIQKAGNIFIVAVQQTVNKVKRRFVGFQPHVLQPFFLRGNIARSPVVDVGIGQFTAGNFGWAHLTHGPVKRFPQVRAAVELQQDGRERGNGRRHRDGLVR